TLRATLQLLTEYSWCLERGGPTRSHPEHGSETPQRRRYWGGDPLRKIGQCQGIWTPEVQPSGVHLFSRAPRSPHFCGGTERSWMLEVGVRNSGCMRCGTAALGCRIARSAILPHTAPRCNNLAGDATGPRH